jgi:hypothetical protein
MFTLQTLLSLAQQIARQVPAPGKLRTRPAKTKALAVGDCAGFCPCCRAFVSIQFHAPGAPAPCPRCGRPIRFVEPPEPA